MSITSSIQKFQDPLANIFRVFGNVAGAFAPSIETGMHMVANKIDGTVGGIEKPLAERWVGAVFIEARKKGDNPEALLTTTIGRRCLDLYHHDLLEEARRKQKQGMTPVEAQIHVIERRERFADAIAHLLR